MLMALEDELKKCMTEVAKMIAAASTQLFDKPDFARLHSEGERICAEIDKGIEPEMSDFMLEGKQGWQDTRTSIAIAMFKLGRARQLAENDNHAAALWAYTEACICAGAATDRLIEAEARANSSRKAQQLSKQAEKQRDDAIRAEIAKLPPETLKNTKAAANAIERTDTYRQLKTPIKDRKLNDLIREHKR